MRLLRLKSVQGSFQRRLYHNIESEAVKMGCTVLALKGMPDHVHLAVSYPATISIADLVKQVKGVSSDFMNETLQPENFFKRSS